MFLQSTNSREEFFFTGLHCRDQAECTLQNSTMGDAQLFNFKKKDKTTALWACGHLMIKELNSRSIEGYEMLQFTAIDLDCPNTKFKLTCQIPNTFRTQKDSQGQDKLPPYKLFPFKLKDDKLNDDDCLSFKTQIYFTDFQANQHRLVFLQGKTREKKVLTKD